MRQITLEEINGQEDVALIEREHPDFQAFLALAETLIIMGGPESIKQSISTIANAVYIAMKDRLEEANSRITFISEN